MEAKEKWALAHPAYERKIRTFCRRNAKRIPDLDAEDLEIEMWEVLWIAILNYDPDRGARFNSYFWQCVMNKWSKLCDHAYAQKRQSNVTAISLDVDAVRRVVEATYESDSPEAEILARETIYERKLRRKR